MTSFLEQKRKIEESMAPMVEEQRKIHDLISPVLEERKRIDAMVSQHSTALSMVANRLEGLGRFAVESMEITQAIGGLACNAINEMTHLASGLNSLINSPVMQEIQTATSMIRGWLQSVDFTPLISIVETIKNYGFDYEYEDVDEIYLKAMFDARWFPYAAWVVDYTMVDAIFEILDTSRASKNRTKRIDDLIFSYYNEDEMMNLKRGWRQLNLPSYMTRILIQSIQAYNRREYALTVSALSTLWEGIIQEKANDDSYRVSGKTRANLNKLIKENEFDEIFSSFCEEFIFYNCVKPEQVKADVPGRHGIAHCWYDTYPNRKVALNAIIFTDFLLRLKPLDQLQHSVDEIVYK